MEKHKLKTEYSSSKKIKSEPHASTSWDQEKLCDGTVAETSKGTLSIFESSTNPLKTENVSFNSAVGQKLENIISCPNPLSLSYSRSPMVPENLTEYERRRLENIKRNSEMLSFLQVQSKLDEVSSVIKAQRAQVKSTKAVPEQKKPTTPIVIRQSLRTRGKPPSSCGLKKYYEESVAKDPKWKQLLFELGPNPFTMKDANCSGSSDKKLTEVILRASKKSKVPGSDFLKRVSDSFNWTSLRLERENVAKVIPERTMVARFFPCMNMSMIAVGNNRGNIGFWDFSDEKEDGHRIYLYRPHPGQVSGIAIHPFSLSEVYSSCYDGFIRLMDVNKEVFQSIYCSNYCISSLSQRQDDMKSLYFGEGRGTFNVWDLRKRNSSMSRNLHGFGITSIDFSSENTNIMATSSRDMTACIWDLRYISVDIPNPLKIVNHKMDVDSAYFSPSGKYLATTSQDNTIGLFTGANFDDVTMINHLNTNRSTIPSSRSIWGWDDYNLLIGNLNGGVDVISTVQRTKVATLESACMYMYYYPYHLAVHPYKIGMLAGAAFSGSVSVWTTC